MKAVNLLPSDLKLTAGRQATTSKVKPDVDRPWGAYGVLVALALVVVGVVALVLAENGVKEREAELARVKVEQQAVAAQAAQLAAFGEFQSLAANRVATVRSLADSRFDWEQALRDLARAIPANVTLSGITGTVAPGVSSGGASSSNPLRSAIAKPAIELEGCTTDQRAVATLMARLRAVQGTTRVALSKSVREEAEANASSGVAAAKPQGCGLGAPAQFEIVSFFETASSAAGTAAPGAPAAGPAAHAGGAAAKPATSPSAAATPGAPAASATPASGTPAVAATPAGSTSPPSSTTQGTETR